MTARGYHPKKPEVRKVHPDDLAAWQAAEQALFDYLKEQYQVNKARLLRDLKPEDIKWMAGDCVTAFFNKRAEQSLRDGLVNTGDPHRPFDDKFPELN